MLTYCLHISTGEWHHVAEHTLHREATVGDSHVTDGRVYLHGARQRRQANTGILFSLS